MHYPFLRFVFLLLLTCSGVSALAADNTATAPASDEALRRAVIGTWLHERTIGVAAVTIYTTYREDGVAVELVRIKIVFKKAAIAWAEYRWSIDHGELHLLPLRFHANTDDATSDTTEVVRQLISVSDREMSFRRQGKERKDLAATLPEDVQKLIDELARK